MIQIKKNLKIELFYENYFDELLQNEIENKENGESFTFLVSIIK